MKAIILAAGYAVRLQPLTLNTPKPLLAVGSKKIIDRILDKIAKLKDLSSIYIITNAKFFENFCEWQTASKHKNEIVIINDGSTSNENRLGAIKDIEIALRTHSIDEEVIVIAGDNLFDFEINTFLGFAKASSDGASIALHDIGNLDSAKRFGVVKIDERKRIIDFEEKPENPKSALISTGIYYFPKSKLLLIKEYTDLGNKLDAPGYYIGWLVKRDKAYGFVFNEDWYDIGSIESYKKANEEYLKKERR